MKIQVKITWMNPQSLTPYARNTKIHTTAQIDKIASQINAHGFDVPIVVDKDLVIIKGHGRREASMRLKLESVPVIVRDDLNEFEVMAARIGDNAVADCEWDEDMLRFEVGTLDRNEYDLGLTGLEMPEEFLKDFELPSEESQEKETEKKKKVEDVEVDEKDDEVPETVPSRVRLGDIWLLGNHVLCCGDAKEPNNYDEKFLGKNKIHMVYTDPPYGCNVAKAGAVGAPQGAWKESAAEKGSYRPIIGDETTETAVSVFNFLKSFDIAAMIFWGANYYASDLPDSSSWIVWDKREDTGIVNTFADGEMAWTNLKKPLRIYRQLWNGMIRRGEHEKRIHPTQKPVGLAEWCIKNFCDGENVLDVFGGSGSTLIACEKLGKKCFMMELDPGYCDLIIARWEKSTKLSARRQDYQNDSKDCDKQSDGE